MLKTFTFAMAAAFLCSPSAADVIRYTFDTEADLSRTDMMNSRQQNETGVYPGVNTTVRGKNAEVAGTLDILRLAGQQEQLSAFDLTVIMPHGVAPESGLPDFTTQFMSTVRLSSLDSAVTATILGGSIRITREFEYVPNFGPRPPWFDTRYSDAVSDSATFLQDVRFRQTTAGGAYAVRNAIVRCVSTSTSFPECNYYGGSQGTWDLPGSGLPASTAIVTPPPPPSPVPLPAGAWILLSGLAGLATLRSARRAKA